MKFSLAAAVLYLALMTLWVYAYANTTLAAHDDGRLLLPIIAIQFAAGLAIGRWWAVFLPALVVLISVPAGLPAPTEDTWEPLPLWFGLTYGAVFAIPLVALGVLSRKVYGWRQR